MVRSVKSGNWSDTATWSNKKVPHFSDSIQISHVVIADAPIYVDIHARLLVDSVGAICGDQLMEVGSMVSVANYGLIKLRSLKLYGIFDQYGEMHLSEFAHVIGGRLSCFGSMIVGIANFDCTVEEVLELVTVAVPCDEPVASVKHLTVAEKELHFAVDEKSIGKVEWSFGDGVQSTEREGKHIYEQAGIYPVSLLCENDCGIDTLVSEVSIVDGNVDVVCESEDTHARIFPNPNAGKFVLEMNLCREQAVRIQIISTSGLVFWTKDLPPSQVIHENIGVETLAAGMYLLLVQTEEKVVSERMVIAK